MKKKTIPCLILTLTGLISCSLTFIYYCPGTLKNIEANNPIWGAEDFFYETLRQPGGVGFIITTWLAQWFYNPIIGGILSGLIVSIISILSGYIVHKKGIHPFLAIVPVCCVASTLVFPDLEKLVQLLATLLLFTGYIRLHIRNKSVAWSLLIILFWPIIGTEAVMALFISFLIIQLTISPRSSNLIYPAIGIVCTYLLPTLWSKLIFYIPEEERLSFNPITPSTLIILYIVLVCCAGRLKHNSSPKFTKAFELLCYLPLIIAIPAHFAYHNGKGTEEQFRQLEQAAEANDWLKVKAMTQDPKSWSNPLYLRYALLAESELGTLSQNLFKYPVRSTTDLYFWRNSSQEKYAFFNSLFYKNIGVADEYMHQIFEMGTKTHPQMSARTIRHLTEAAIMQHDQKLARKYYLLACRSQKNPKWQERIRQKIETLNKENPSTNAVPERSEFFIGTYLPQIEFAYMAMDDTNNMKRINYLLCSILLEQDIHQFLEGLSFFEEQLPQKLPRVFQEAYLILKTTNPELNLKFTLSEEEVQNWIRFLNLKEKQDYQTISQYYPNSYWTYFFFEKPKQLQ